MFIEYHRTLLADRRRNAAWERALAAVVVPGESIVIDIGAGTGFLGFLARRLGAREVFLIDDGPVLSLAERLAADNGLDRLVFLNDHSTAVGGLPPADVIVSETLGNFALEEQIVETLNDARRLLKPGGVMMPAGLEQYVAPLRAPSFRDELCIWDHVGYGLDLAAARRMSLNNLYVRRVDPAQLLPAAARRWDNIDFRAARPPASARHGRVSWAITGQPSPAVVVHGFAAWWRCEIHAGITLDTAPDAAPTHWEQIYLPLSEPIALEAGETLELELGVDASPSAGTKVQWRTRRRTAEGRVAIELEQDLDAGGRI